MCEAPARKEGGREGGCSWPRYDGQQPVPSGGGNNMGITGAHPGWCRILLHSAIRFFENISLTWECWQGIKKKVQIIVENTSALGTECLYCILVQEASECVYI